jgi:hypothetical protein
MEKSRYQSLSDWQRSDLKSKVDVKSELGLSRLLDYRNDEVLDEMRKGAGSAPRGD